jgi:hypothetical protein
MAAILHFCGFSRNVYGHPAGIPRIIESIGSINEGEGLLYVLGLNFTLSGQLNDTYYYDWDGELPFAEFGIE